jgi:hypothetical protein
MMLEATFIACKKIDVRMLSLSAQVCRSVHILCSIEKTPRSAGAEDGKMNARRARIEPKTTSTVGYYKRRFIQIYSLPSSVG